MIDPFNRKAKFEKLLNELKVGVLGQMIGFAADVAEEIDSFARRRLFGLSSKAPSFARQFSSGPPKTSTTHVNQLLLCVEALSFYWHAIDRLSFRPKNEALRAAILDPVAISLSEMLAEVFNKKGMNTTGTEQLMAVRKSEPALCRGTHSARHKRTGYQLRRAPCSPRHPRRCRSPCSFGVAHDAQINGRSSRVGLSKSHRGFGGCSLGVQRPVARL